MKRIALILVLSLLAAACVIDDDHGTRKIGFVQVKPGQVGVKTYYWWLLGNGISDRVYRDQLVFVWPGQSLDIISTQNQKLEMTRRLGQGDRTGRDNLRVKTSDGNDVWVDVTITFRFLPDRATDLLRELGHDPGNGDPESIKERILRPIARGIVRTELGRLTSEQFYDPVLREEMAAKALERLTESVTERWGIETLDVLVREFHFSDEYQEAITERKLADQRTEEAKSLQEAARQEAQRKKNEAKGKADATIEQAQGDFEKVKLEADARLFELKQQAEGRLAVLKAEADGIAASISALQGEGGKTMVAEQVAASLQGKRILLLPAGTEGGLQVTDFNELINQFNFSRIIKQGAAGDKGDAETPPSPSGKQQDSQPGQK